MERTETTFLSEADQLSIAVLTVRPEGKPRGIVQIAHGMCENKERYLPFMEYLAGHGYVSVINDHRGHGQSVYSKEDLGYMYGGGADALLLDMRTLNRIIREEYPELPLILFGHSMGSLAVRAFAAAHDEAIDALIVCGTPSRNPGRPVGQAIAKIEGKLRGSQHRSRLLTAMALGGYSMRFRKEESPVAWICTDREVQRAYEESEYCGFLFSDDAYETLFELMKRAYDIKNWNCANPDLPILFISGEQDPCMGNMRQFSIAVHAMRYAGYRDVKGKVYSGMRHEILNEPEHEKVFHDVTSFLSKKGF